MIILQKIQACQMELIFGEFNERREFYLIEEGKEEGKSKEVDEVKKLTLQYEIKRFKIVSIVCELYGITEDGIKVIEGK